jgi:hypothetical protein
VLAAVCSSRETGVGKSISGAPCISGRKKKSPGRGGGLLLAVDWAERGSLLL